MGDVTAIVAEARRHLPVLGETLGDVAAALQPVLTDCDSLAAPDLVQPQNRLVHHRDWREARRAAIRALLVIVGVGLIWSVSHWSKGPLMLMALAIMISIFSNKEHPAGFVGNIFIGAAIGSAVAIFCRTALLPGVPNPLLTGAIIAPSCCLGFWPCSIAGRPLPPPTRPSFFSLSRSRESRSRSTPPICPSVRSPW